MSVLTSHCICALQTATKAACIEAIDSCSPQDLWSHVLGIVYPIIQTHARLYTSRLRLMSRLPDELLVEIFAHLPVPDRIRTATVCHRWRAVSLNAVPALWTDVPHLDDVDTYYYLFARARDFPVMLEYTPQDLSSIGTFCDILSRNLHRLRVLTIGFPVPDSDDEALTAADAFVSALAGPALILQSLCISDQGGILDESYNALSVLGNPVLRTLELQSFSLSGLEAFAGSSALRSLKISTHRDYDTLLQEDWLLLASFPALERFALHLTSVDRIAVPAHCSPLPRSLQHLHVELDGDCFDQFISLDDLSRFQTLHVSFLCHPPSARRLAVLMPSLLAKTVSASVQLFWGDFNLMAEDGHGRCRVLANLDFNFDWPTLVPNATRLWVDVSSYRGGKTTVLPAVEELVLVAPTSIASGAVPLWPSLECPRLRAVRLVSDEAGPALVAGVVLRYLRRLLGAQPRLATLVLDRVALDPVLGFDVHAALHAIAEQVSTVRSETVSPESPRVWLDSWGKFSL